MYSMAQVGKTFRAGVARAWNGVEVGGGFLANH